MAFHYLFILLYFLVFDPTSYNKIIIGILKLARLGMELIGDIFIGNFIMGTFNNIVAKFRIEIPILFLLKVLLYRLLIIQGLNIKGYLTLFNFLLFCSIFKVKYSQISNYFIRVALIKILPTTLLMLKNLLVSSH